MKAFLIGLGLLVTVWGLWRYFSGPRIQLGSYLSDPQRRHIAERDHVPLELIGFLDMVHKWGALESDSQRYSLADYAESNPSLLKELKDYNDSWTPELQKVHEKWAKGTSLTDNESLAGFYFTFLLLDELQFKLPRDENADPVQELMEDLRIPGERSMWSCRFLPDYEEQAAPAIPLLREAVDDSEPQIRIWAHYALARLEGNEARHRQAIHEIGRGEGDERIQSEVKSALDELDRSLEQHRLGALCGYCITGDLKQIRRIAPLIEVDGLDHHGARPLGYAVGNGQLEAVRILLERGADPNLPTRSQESYLHNAAWWRDNGEMITLLTEHGADVLATNSDGLTPRQIAKAHRRPENAKVLRALESRKKPE